MARGARRREKQRIKRKQKQLAHRKAKGVTALQKVALLGGMLECYVNPDWQGKGLASIIVLAKTPGGRCAYAGFLVDVWCVGLKDAWGKSEASAAEIQELRERAVSHRIGVRMAVEEARRLVTGGVRFSRQNGFRLPDHWQKWVSVFGEMGPPESVDLTGFGIEAEGGATKLRYVGTEQFLRSRLTASTVEAFMARPDVEVLMDVGGPGEFDEDDDETGDEEEAFDDAELDDDAADLADILRETSLKTASEVRKWCFANGVVPHRLLEDAAQLLIIGLLPAMAHEDGVASGEIPQAQGAPDRWGPVESALAEYPPAERQEMRVALDQVTRFMQSFSDPAAMLAAMGIGPSDEEEEGEAGPDEAS
jgi:hypothetical protein